MEGKEDALNDFCKKFFDKTRNEWVERGEFQKVNGKYDLVEQDFGEAEVAKKEEIKEEGQPEVKIEPCDLDQPVQDWVFYYTKPEIFEILSQTMPKRNSQISLNFRDFFQKNTK